MSRRSLALVSRALQAVATPGRLTTNFNTRFLRRAAVSSTTSTPYLPQCAGPGRSRSLAARQIRTLHPCRLQASDFIDVADLEQPRVHVRLNVDTQPVTIRYGSMRNKGRFDFLRFPRNARGFLYYHHDPELPLTAGEIRFRLTTDSDVAGFKSGRDLVGPYGVPWAINLAVLTRPCYEVVRKRLLEDGLIDPGLMRNILEGWGRKYTNGHGICLHYLEQPFPAQLSRKLYLRIFTPHAIGTVQRRLWSPYPGVLLLRFERSTLPEHAGTRTVVLRVLKILEPVKAVIPGHDMRIPEPKEGDLLQTRSYGGLIRPFSINIDKPAKTVKDIGLLYSQ